MNIGNDATPLRENPDVAIEQLFREYGRAISMRPTDDSDRGRIRFLLSDFRNRIRLTPRPVFQALIRSAFHRYGIPFDTKGDKDGWDDLRGLVSKIDSDHRSKRSSERAGSPPFSADVIIVNVIDVELQATKRCLDLSDEEIESFRYKGNRFYRILVPTSYGKELLVYLTMIGGPRNVRCANACRDIFELFEAGATFLVGIAAGNKNKVKLGDVVAATNVLDLEGGRLEFRPIVNWFPYLKTRRMKRRLETIPVPQLTRMDFEYFAPDGSAISKETRDMLLKHDRWIKKVGKESKDVESEYHTGPILSGEKLIADGSIPEIANNVNDSLLAGEMEGNGFAFTQSHQDTRWGIIRGISDYGDPEKSDGWQPAAAVAAAITLRHFLRNSYRPPEIDIAF